MMDDNVDTLNNYMTIDRCKNSNIKDIRDNFLVSNSVTCLNDKPTFFRRNVISCFDHIYNTSPQYIDTVTTHNYNLFNGTSTISDHFILTFSYRQDDTILQPLYKIVRDYHN